MTIRFCGACGTEIDETAAFCPSCGRALGDDPSAPRGSGAWEESEEGDKEQLTAAWTPPASGDPDAAVSEPAADDAEPAEHGSPRVARGHQRDEVSSGHPRTEQRGKAAGHGGERRASSGGDQPAAERRSRPSLPSVQLPVTWPVTLAAWLIGIGALIGVLALFLPWTIAPATGWFDRWGLTSPVNLLLLLALIAIAASVFFSSHVPDFAYRRLGIMVVVLIGLGVGLDRLGIGSAGFGAVLFFLGMLAASIGALLLETGADRPLSGPGA